MGLSAAPPRQPEPSVAAPPPPELQGVPPARALNAWIEACEQAGRPARLPAVRIPITEASGRVTAEPVWALRSSPAFPAAAMDGIAVRAADTAGATSGRPVRLLARSFEVVDTGDPLPSGRDAVVMRERVRLEGEAATVEAEVSAGHHVRAVGDDIAAGELLFTPGHRLRPTDVAAAAAAGATELAVRRMAVVAIIPTGDEMRPAGSSLADGELADTNSLMLDGQAREAGCVARRWPIVPDDPDKLAAALDAAGAASDLVILVAGTSRGRRDHALGVLRRCGRVVVRGVAMRPGHPAVLGVVGRTPVMACPGYPVSAALAFDELALPILASLDGAPARRRPEAAAHLAADVRSRAGSYEWLRIGLGTVDGRRVAVPLRRGASVLTSLARADALVSIPAQRDAVAAGAAVQAQLVRPGAHLDGALLLAGAPDRSLDLLTVALADAPSGATRVAFCEMAPGEAVELVREGLCHAAAVAGTVGAPPIEDAGARLVGVRLAECDMYLATGDGCAAPATPDDVLRRGIRVAVGPQGTPARRVLDDAVRASGAACEISEMRSDAAAVAAVAQGHADCAVSARPAALRAGLTTLALGRAAFDLVIHRAPGDDDPAVRALLDGLRSPSLALALEADGYDAGGIARRAADGRRPKTDDNSNREDRQ